MAIIKIQGTNETIENQVDVSSFLEQEGVIYEQWDTAKLPAHLQEKYVLTDEEKQEILAAFQRKFKIFLSAAAIRHRMSFRWRNIRRTSMNC